MKGPGGNGAILGGALKELRDHWERAGSGWRDQARHEFNKDFLDELIPAVVAASNAAQQIEEFLRQVHRECD